MKDNVRPFPTYSNSLARVCLTYLEGVPRWLLQEGSKSTVQSESDRALNTEMLTQ